MGLAASQCRLLLLTARMHDTEYRAQMISQRRMQLAMQTEQIATDYTRAMRNRALYHVYDLNGNEIEVLKEQLNYSTLMSESRFGGGQFRVVLPDGRIAVSSPSDVPGMVGSYDSKTKTIKYADGSNPATVESYIRENLCGGDDAKVEEMLKTLGVDGGFANPEFVKAFLDVYQTDATYQAYILSKGYEEVSIESDSRHVGSATLMGSDGKEYVVMPALNNAEFFQNAIRTGGIFVEQYSKYNEDDGWAVYDIIDSPYLRDNLNTTDDAAAQAEYESKSALIQSQDKQLEIELKQVETQHQAAQTEYDSVKKVIDKNIERSFKTFG